MSRRNRRPFPVWRPTWIEVALVIGTIATSWIYLTH